MEIQNPPAGKLTFTQFKDWAFLGVLSLLVMILVHAIYDLNDSVKRLSENLAEKSGELQALEIRVSRLEKE